MTMTIEFLRARLLSERAASKAAKHEADQLSKKVWHAHSGPSVLDISSMKHFCTWVQYNKLHMRLKSASLLHNTHVRLNVPIEKMNCLY
jgi:hypothetical protein